MRTAFRLFRMARSLLGIPSCADYRSAAAPERHGGKQERLFLSGETILESKCCLPFGAAIQIQNELLAGDVLSLFGQRYTTDQGIIEQMKTWEQR